MILKTNESIIAFNPDNREELRDGHLELIDNG